MNYQPLFDYFDKQENVSTEIQACLESLKASIKERPVFTEKGLAIFRAMRALNAENLKAKDIAAAMEIPAKTVSGSMKRLVDDGFVSAYGKNPSLYTLTEYGKNYDISNL